MASWQDVVDSEPDFARSAQALFDAHKHKTIATLRKDGAPRISGIEAGFADGHVWVGMMEASLKLADVLRDPRIALHSASEDPPDDVEQSGGWSGDAKLSGRVREMDGAMRATLGDLASQPGSYFTIDLDEVVWTRLGDPPDHLLISLWRPDKPLRETKRY